MASRRFLSILPALVLLLGGCLQDEEATPLYCIVSSSSWRAPAGDLVWFDVIAASSDAELETLVISSFDAENGTKELMTRQLSGLSQTFRWEYQAPFALRDTLVIQLSFKVIDSAGSEFTSVYDFRSVGGSSKLLEERSGFILFSGASCRDCEFDFRSLSTCAEGEGDIYVNESEEDGLHVSFQTRNGLVLERWNSFDYPNATSRSVSATINGCTMHGSVESLSLGDVVLAGRKQYSADSLKSYVVPLGVIRISEIAESADGCLDHIVFALKTL